MTSLVKFCKPQHNLLDRCHTVRVGTFQYYRDMDPKFAIADPTEGAETTKVASLPIGKATPEAAAEVRGIGMGPYNELTNVTISTDFPNSYVWCCSRHDSPPTATQGKVFDDDYTSFYLIPDAQRFSEYLCSLLMSNISLHQFADPIREKLGNLAIAELGQISLSVFHRPIRYVDSKVSTVDDGFFKSYAPDIPRPLRPIFVKPMQFSKDKEYRFVFIFQHRRHGILSVQPDPVDLPAIPIATSS